MLRAGVVARRNIPPLRTPGAVPFTQQLEEGGTLRLFRMLVPVAVIALVVIVTAGAKSTRSRRHRPSRRGSCSRHAGNDWLTVGGGLNDNRHSTLTQINARQRQRAEARVDRHVQPAGRRGCSARGGRRARLQGVALHAGRPERASRRSTGPPARRSGTTTRRTTTLRCSRPFAVLAIGDGKVFEGQNDGNVVALDQRPATSIWKTKVGDPTDGIQFTSAPVYYNGHGDRGRFRR